MIYQQLNTTLMGLIEIVWENVVNIFGLLKLISDIFVNNFEIIWKITIVNFELVEPYLFKPLIILLSVLNNNRNYLWFFLCITFVYWNFYDGRKNGYLSRIYQNDKYGIVILYIVFSIFSLLHTFQGVMFLTMSTSDCNIESGNHLRLDYQFNHLITLSLLVLLKILCFILIFKNNTSKNLSHQIIHIICCLFLSVISICSYYIEVDSRYLFLSSSEQCLREKEMFCENQFSDMCVNSTCNRIKIERLSHLVKLIICCFGYQISGHVADKLKSYKKVVVVLNFLTMMIGSILIMETL